MHRQVPAIAARLSLRPPQRRSLEILDRVVEIARPRKDADKRVCSTNWAESHSQRVAA